MIVVDASALIELLGGRPAGSRIRKRLGSESLHVPYLVDLEVAQVARRLLLRDEIGEARAMQLIRHLSQFDLVRHPHEPLLERIWAFRHNLTAYDAAYVALAEVLGCDLVTCDGPLATLAARWVGVEHFAER